MMFVRRRILHGGLMGIALASAAPCHSQGQESMPSDDQPVLRYVLATEGLPENRPKDQIMWKSTPVLVDINEDGFLDLIAYSRLGSGARVWLGDGKGNWTPASEGLGMDFSCGGGVAVGDVNKDGHLDLAIADHCQGVFVYLGDGRGSWKASTRELTPAIAKQVDLSVEGENPFIGAEDLALGDVDEDGFLDLVVAASFEGGLSVYLGDGSGKTWKESVSDGLPSGEDPEADDPERGGWANQVRLYDIDGDGHLDILASYYAGPRVWRGDGKGRWSAYSEGLPTHLLGGLLAGSSVGDVNEDGRMDIAVANWINGPEVFLQNADGTWQATPDVLPAMRGGAQGVALGDLDRDGHLDMLVGGRQSPTGTGFGLFVLKGNGKGEWTALQNTGIPSSGLPTIWGVAVGDVNEDGWLDFAVSTGGELEKPFPRPKKPETPSKERENMPLMQVWVNEVGLRTDSAEKTLPEQ